MFFFRYKIRKLNKLLDSREMPKDLHQITKAIEKNGPSPARSLFQKDLRSQLLLQHQKMMNDQVQTDDEKNEFNSASDSSQNVFWKKGWSFVLAVFFIFALVGITGYSFIPAPQVEGYYLKASVRKISFNAPIKIVFTQPMDRGSVEKAFQIEPKIEGTFEWALNSLYFKPKAPFKVGDIFTVSINRNAKSIFQKNLPGDYLENFEITGAPQVSVFSPNDKATEVPTDAHLTVHFDRPMIAVTTLDQGVELAPFFKIEPNIKGKIKWLGTNSIRFVPDQLMHATHYTITIPKGTLAADGGRTEADFQYSFDTLKPQLLSTEPSNNDSYTLSYAGPETKTKLSFNQPMNLEKAKPFIHLYVYKGDRKKLTYMTPEWIKKRKNYDPKKTDKESFQNINDAITIFEKEHYEKVPFQLTYYTLAQYKLDNGYAENDTQEQLWPEESELHKTLVLTPAKALDYDQFYLVKIDQDLKAAEGQFGLEESKKVLIKTVGDIRILKTVPEQKAQPSSQSTAQIELSTETREGRSIQFAFSQPMDLESLRDKIVIEPKSYDLDTKEEKKPDLSFDEEKTHLYLNYDFQPFTNYRVILKPGAKDLFGKILEQETVLNFKTPPLKPSFHVSAISDLNVLDADKPPVFYFNATNISGIHINFKKLSQEEFDKIYSKSYINFYDKDAIPKGPFLSWDKKFKNISNKTSVQKIDLAQESGTKLDPGYYYFDVSSDEVKDRSQQPIIERRVFMLTYSGLTVKMGQKKALVWATSLRDGAPIEGMDITIKPRRVTYQNREVYNDDEKIQELKLQAKTDKNGVVSFDIPEGSDLDSSLILGQKGNDFTMSNTSWGEGIQPWNFNLDYGSVTSKYYAYVYTDRPIYRPGHTVYFKGLVRVDQDASFRLPNIDKVHVVIHDNEEQKFFEKDLPLNRNGTFHGEFTLGNQASTGDYRISITSKEMSESIIVSGAPGFEIAEYRKPDYQVSITPEKDRYINGQKAQIKIKGSYFFGAPMPNASIDWTVKSQDYFFFLGPDSKSPYASQWFSFSDEGYQCYFRCEGESAVVSTGKAKLDANGEYTIDLPLNITDKKMSQFYTIEVTAFDLNNQTVSNRATITIDQGEYYVGILNPQGVTKSGEEATFQVITLDPDGNPVREKPVEISFFKRIWNTVKKKNVDSDFYYENSYDDMLLEKKTVMTNDKGFAEVSFLPKEGGSFKASAQAKDQLGNVIGASTNIYASSSTFINWGRENNDRIEMVPDKLEYKPGDTAHILIKSPYQKVRALITYERMDVLTHKIIEIQSNSAVIDIPITEKYVPNVFVSVVLVKGSSNNAGLSEPPKNGSDEREVAAFKVGYTTLQVNNSSKKLQIQLEPDRQKYHPGDEVTLNVKTTDVNGKPVKAELSVSIVDKSVLSLTENFTADLLNEFYRKRFLGVRTSETLTKALSRINVQVEAGLKGGGGGDDVRKRDKFKDTAFWQAVVETDAKGLGQVKFKTPDNLTTWQALAIGITPQTQVGSKKTDFLVTKDVLIRPVLPRFLIVNDEMTVGGIVHNYLDKPMDFDITLETKGVLLKGKNKKQVRIGAGEEQKIDFLLNVQNEKEASFIFKAIAIPDSNIGDIVEIKVPVHAFSFPEVVATSSVISDNDKHVETIWLPSNIDKKFGELTMTIAPTLASSITKGIEYLVKYPYGCNEQIASSLLPNLIVKQMLELPGIGKNVEKIINLKELEKNSQAGIQALSKTQQSNGGWGLWVDSKTSPYVSAYVLFTLHEAQKAGYTVDEKILNRGLDYLKVALKQNNRSNMAIILGLDAESSDYAADKNARAFILNILAEMGKGDLSLSNNLYDNRKNLNLSAKANLAMAFHSLMKQEQLDGPTKESIQRKIKILKQEILTLAKETPRDVHFEEVTLDYGIFDTNTRTTALVLQMLSRIDDKNPLIPKILHYVLRERKDGHYGSTHETAIGLLALIDYLKSSKELDVDYEGTVTLNTISKLNRAFSVKNIGEKESITIPLSELLQNNQDNEITAVREGKGKMYFDMNLKYYLPTEKILARDEGMVVHQEYFSIDDKKAETPLTRVKVGDNLKGKITVIVPEDRYYVMVEDFLPAGLEGIDFNLNISQQNLQDQRQAEDCQSWRCWQKYWRFNHSEVRDDRMMYFADYLPAGVYEIEYFVRATTPGTFHDLPTLASQTYFPEVFGRSEGRNFIVENNME